MYRLTDSKGKTIYRGRSIHRLVLWASFARANGIKTTPAIGPGSSRPQAITTSERKTA